MGSTVAATKPVEDEAMLHEEQVVKGKGCAKKASLAELATDNT
jgi:hypothetical protein